MSLTVEQIADLVQTTLSELGEGKWTDLTGDLQEYVVMPRLLVKDKVKFAGGKGHSWNVMVGTTGNAKRVGLYETDTPAVADQLVQASLGWAHATTNYSFARQEINMNTGKRQLLELVKTRRADADIDLAKLLEVDFWGGQDVVNNLKPMGVKNWLCYSPTAGFNGAAAAGFTTVAGLNPTTYPRWRNYTDQYAAVTKADLMAKVRQAMTKCLFKSPLAPGDAPSYRRSDRRGLYTCYSVLAAMELLAEAQNDSLGSDLASKDGAVTIRRVPVEYVPQLDNETASKPIVGIDWGVFYPAFLDGEYMVETTTPSATQHTVVTTHKDLTYQWICKDRRPNFLIALAGW